MSDSDDVDNASFSRKGKSYKNWMDPNRKSLKPRSTMFYQTKMKNELCKKYTTDSGESSDSNDSDMNSLLPSKIMKNNFQSEPEECQDFQLVTNDVAIEAESEVDEDWINIFQQSIEHPTFCTDDEDEREAQEVRDLREKQKLQKSKQKNISFLNTVLKKQTIVNYGEIILMCMLLGVRHSLTWLAMLDIFKLIDKLFDSDVLMLSKYKLIQFFPENKNWFQYHIYCPKCKYYIGNRSNLANSLNCPSCDILLASVKKSPYFLTLNIESQLRELLENALIQPHLQYKYNRKKINADGIEDILDGQLYKKLSSEGNILHEQWNFSYTFNTDGCQASDSSSVSIWPVYIKINELPPTIRNNNLLLVGIWVSEEKPVMNTFMQPIVEDLNRISDGMTWKMDGQIITSKIVALCCCVDSVCRCGILNMKQYNGHFGCTFCLHPTETINKVVKYPMREDVPALRTHIDIVNDMHATHSINPESGATTVSIVRGVKGPSVLMNLNYFDLSDGMTPDSMHCVFLGVTEQYTNIILSDVDKPYYVGSPSNLNIINQRLLTIKAPTTITRTPRSLVYKSAWKASEWRSWLIFYSILCLKGVLPSKYIKHLSLLVSAIHILLSDSITKSKLKHAHELLLQFVFKFQTYFGESQMTYNIHLLLHLAKAVENLGPLHMHDAFCFENENRVLLNMKKSPKDIAIQISKRYIFYKSIPLFSTYFPIGKRVLEFIEDFEQKVKSFVQVQSTVVIGVGKNYVFNEDEQNIGYVGNCLSYEKIIHKNVRYTTNNYVKNFKFDDSIIETHRGQKGVIKSICLINDGNEKHVAIFCYIIKTLNIDVFDACEIKHIKECVVRHDKIFVCSPQDLKGHCILINLNGKNYIINVFKGCTGD